MTTPPPAPEYGPKAPFPAEVRVNRRLTPADAGKDVRHIELSLAGSGLHYEPGDSIGVRHQNPPELVAGLLDALRLDPAALATREGRTLPLGEWLASELEITRLSRPFLTQHAELSGSEELKALLASSAHDALRSVLATHQLIDILRRHPAPWTPDALVLALRKVAPRLYSVASSQAHVGDEAHLLVAVVDYLAFDHRHLGAASTYLAAREPKAQTVDVHVARNPHFRLPADATRDVLMIGPGTGVAPFRAFLQERQARGAGGRSWLFFGEQYARGHFHYETEWRQALARGSLSRLSTAFSRDQPHKIYVQHRLLEEGKDVWAWLEGGATLYLCGDATRMAADVHAALIEIAGAHGGKGPEEAEAYFKALRAEKRYLKDVY